MLKKRGDNQVKYLKLVKGNFYLTSDKDNENPFGEMEGFITDLFIGTQTFKGTPIKKLNVVVTDGDEKGILGVRWDSRETTMLLGFLKNAKLDKPLAIRAALKKEKNAEGEDVERSNLFVVQDGHPLSSAFTKSKPNGLPQMRKVKLNGKIVWDKEDYLNFYEKLVGTLKSQLASKIKQEVTEEIYDSVDEDEESLPF